LILIPWLMQAAARGETGSEADEAEVYEKLAGANELLDDGTGAGETSATPCGFASSFFHMEHLDSIFSFSKSPFVGW
jgi:hypothetical protein